MLRLALGVGLQLWIVGFILFFGAEVVHLEPQLRVATQLLYAVPLAAWAAVHFGRRRHLRRPDLLDGAVLLALLLHLAVAPTSRDRTGSLEATALAALYALLFLLLREAAASDWLRSRIAVGSAVGLALSLAFNAYLLVREKVEFFAVTGRLPQLEGRVVFPWETVNAMPILVLLALPVVAWMPATPVRRISLGVIAASALVVLPFSAGRAGYLGLGTAAVAFGVLSPGLRARFTSLERGYRWALAAAAVAAMAVVTVAGAPMLAGAMQSSGRSELYAASWSMFGDRPLVGHGPGTYSWARLLYGSDAARLLAVRLTHDVPLQTLVDGGLVLAAGMAGAALAWLARAVGGGLPLARRASVAALAGYAVAVTLDDFSFLPSLTAVVICLAAFALPTRSAAPGGSSRSFGWVPPLVAGAVLVVAAPSAARVDQARLAAGEARLAAVAGDWTQAVDGWHAAVAAHPESGLYRLGLAQALAEVGNGAAARDAYREAVRVSPGDPRGYAGQAALLPDPAAGLALLEQAASRTIGDPSHLYRLGLALAEAGEPGPAAEAWARAVVLQPGIFGVLPYRAAGIDRESVLRAAAVQALSGPRSNPQSDLDARWDIGLALGTLPPEAGAAWQAVASAQDGALGRARELADAAVDEDPNAARSYQALAAVAAFACDDAAERQALRWEAATRGAWGPPGPKVAVHREFVYREASLGDMQPSVVQDLPHPDRWPWSLIARPECGA